MKAKFVNEKLERGKKPVGPDSPAGIDAKIKAWQKKGLKFGWMFFSGDEVEKKREYFAEYYPHLEKYLNELHDAGVKWEDMTFWGDHVDVKTYRISKGNWSLFHCLTKEDAENLVKIIENIATGNQNYVIEEDRDHINLSDKMHKDNDPETRAWMERMEKSTGEKRRTDLDFLENIEKTRKKLNSIK